MKLKVTATYTKDFEVEVPDELYHQAYGEQKVDTERGYAVFDMNAIEEVDKQATAPALEFAKTTGAEFIDLEWVIEGGRGE